MKVAAAALLPALLAQTPAPRFEVASVKANVARTGVRLHSFPGDRFEATNVPLRDLILVAFGEAGLMLPDPDLQGGPAWIDSDRFDISAKVGSAGANTVLTKQRMLRTLLEDRFHLRVHTESKDLPIYALRLARKDRRLGPKLQPANVDCEGILASQPGKRERCILYALPNGVLMLRGQTMRALANVLTQLLGGTVRDETGLTGGFDADSRFDPSDLPGMAQLPASERPPETPALNTALREDLGLELQTSRGRVDVVMIDSVDRPLPN
jgi:uncharacterized protein (TIGR03435 family)